MLFIIGLSSVCCFAQKENPVSGRTWAVQMARSIMHRHPEIYYDWDYVTGTVLRGFEEAWKLTGDSTYFAYIESTLDPLVGEDGSIKGYRIDEYNIDEVQAGRMLLFLYQETGKEKYKNAADLVRSQFENHPRLKLGGLWHKQIYPWQMWLDGLYMGQPFYAEYAYLFDQPEVFDDVVRQFVLIEDHMKDPQTGLYYHAWDESRQMFWADKETGLSQCFWGRGLGWFAMAIVDVLDYLPPTHPGRARMIKMLKELADTITKYQDEETGLWWQVLDQGHRTGNYLEGSGSAMFVYSLAKAIRMKYIDESYMKTVLKGFNGLTTYLMYKDSWGDYNLLRICRSAGLGGKYQEKIRDGSYGYYVYIEPIRPNDGKGTGPFLAACVEMARLGY
ncbi:glycoside hydrolase family 88 protein [bacterium]|nr:glycoside hydrolase family 88 protein [bacterium]